MLSPWCTLRMACETYVSFPYPLSAWQRDLTSANTFPTSSTSSFGHARRCSSCGTLFVHTTLSSALALIRSTASPLKTPWVTRA